MKIDYRITEYCEKYIDIIEKKKKLQSDIQSKHRTNNIYQYVSKRESNEKREFAKIYNYRCAYCGAKISHTHIDSYEIDHYFGRKQNQFINESNINEINNLIFSCMRCNRDKCNFDFVDNYHAELLNPDMNIQNVFERDELYKIVISKKYNADKIILEFYNKLNLGADIRRIEYLLTKIEGIQSNTKDEKIKLVFYDAYELIKNKMSMMNFLSE